MSCRVSKWQFPLALTELPLVNTSGRVQFSSPEMEGCTSEKYVTCLTNFEKLRGEKRISYQRPTTVMRGSRGGGQGVWTPPWKNHKNIGFLTNTGLDPLKILKATKPAFNVGPSSAFQLRFPGRPMTAR